MAIKNTNTVLNIGIIYEMQNQDGSWSRIPRITTGGAIGEMAEAKEKTVIEETERTYGVGLRDSPDKNIQGQVIPPQEVGGTYENDRALQQTFFQRARDTDEFGLRVTFPDLERHTIDRWQALGFQIDDAAVGEWKMFTCNGKQNTTPRMSVAGKLASVSISGLKTVAVGEAINLTLVPSPGDAYFVPYEAFMSSDNSVATVTPSGQVTGVSEGPVTITGFLGKEGIESTTEITVTE